MEYEAKKVFLFLCQYWIILIGKKMMPPYLLAILVAHPLFKQKHPRIHRVKHKNTRQAWLPAIIGSMAARGDFSDFERVMIHGLGLALQLQRSKNLNLIIFNKQQYLK